MPINPYKTTTKNQALKKWRLLGYPLPINSGRVLKPTLQHTYFLQKKTRKKTKETELY